MSSPSELPLEIALSGARNPDTEEEEEEDDDELDETLSERLWGLTEMFPNGVRSAAGATFDFSVCAAKKVYSFSRSALWIGTTSFMILVLPVVFETEKLQMEQQQQLQQRQFFEPKPEAGSTRKEKYFASKNWMKNCHKSSCATLCDKPLRILLGPSTGMSGSLPPIPGKV